MLKTEALWNKFSSQRYFWSWFYLLHIKTFGFQLGNFLYKYTHADWGEWLRRWRQVTKILQTLKYLFPVNCWRQNKQFLQKSSSSLSFCCVSSTCSCRQLYGKILILRPSLGPKGNNLILIWSHGYYWVEIQNKQPTLAV